MTTTENLLNAELKELRAERERLLKHQAELARRLPAAEIELGTAQSAWETANGAVGAAGGSCWTNSQVASASERKSR